ncbi:MAG: tetratricopeptide (TPR) repeat protein [Arenicella sp.]|jgi:tetratricopeptide (TPR) repeat protein
MPSKVIILILLVSLLLSSICNADNKSTTMSNHAYLEAPQTETRFDAAKYYRVKTQAIAHSRRNEWQQSLGILERLTKQYENDGITWYLLGLSYFNTEQYKQSIPALEKALSLG